MYIGVSIIIAFCTLCCMGLGSRVSVNCTREEINQAWDPCFEGGESSVKFTKKKKKTQTFINLYRWIVCAQWTMAFWAGCSLREERLFQHMIGGDFILRKHWTKPWLNALGNKGFFIRRRLSWISEHLVEKGSEEESWDVAFSLWFTVWGTEHFYAGYMTPQLITL